MKDKFHVLENDKPATLKDSIYSCWHNNIFDSLDEAITYARQWLGIYEPDTPYNFVLGIPYHYQQGSYITIIKVNS